MSGSIRTRKAMSKKELKAPVIPKKLALVKDAKNILEESAEQEYEIINRLFENIFLTKIHAGHLEIKQTVFRGCRFTGCDFSETSFTNVRFVECDFQIQILAMLTLSVVLFRNVKQWVLIFTAAG